MACHYMPLNEWDIFFMYRLALSSYKYYLLELPNGQYFHYQLRPFPTKVVHIIFYSKFQPHLMECGRVCFFNSKLDHFFEVMINIKGCILSYVNTCDEALCDLNCPFMTLVDLSAVNMAQIDHMYFIIINKHAWFLSFIVLLKLML